MERDGVDPGIDGHDPALGRHIVPSQVSPSEPPPRALVRSRRALFSFHHLLPGHRSPCDEALPRKVQNQDLEGVDQLGVHLGPGRDARNLRGSGWVRQGRPVRQLHHGSRGFHLLGDRRGLPQLAGTTVAPLFAPGRLRNATQQQQIIGECIRDFMDQFRLLKEANDEVDILDLCARLSIDVVTGYLLGRRYDGLHEHDDLPISQRKHTKLSANPFVFSIVAFARFSLLPNWLFRCTYAASTWWASSPEVDRSFKRLGEYSDRLLKKTSTASQAEGIDSTDRSSSSSPMTYQGRLLAAGISPFEAKVQAQATIFAGADSTAIVLATILFHLVQNPSVNKRLHDEVESPEAQNMDTSQLPYLRAVVKEGLRLAMTNPTRLTRVVPPSGLQVCGQTIPPGTVVGCAAYVLHHDADVFDKPFEFQPERWLLPSTDEIVPSSIHDGDEVSHRLLPPKKGQQRELMEKHMIPFGVGLRDCLGKNLAMQEIHEAVRVVAASNILEGATTIQHQIKMKEWFNGEIIGHRLEIKWC